MLSISKFKTMRLLPLLAVIVFISCGDDDGTVTPSGPDPVAAFSFEANELVVTFTNNSTNATSFEWNFGDGSDASTEESPVHTYAEAGSYTVTLTAKNDEGGSNEFSASLSVASVDEKVKLLAGETSKTWKLVREGTAMSLWSDPNYTTNYWPGSSNDGVRPCLYDDEFTFGRDGSFTFNDAGTFWAEFGVFNGVADETCTNNTPESCFEASAANMVNQCGDDVSAWLSGSHTYTFDAGANRIKLEGMGAWIGIPKLGTGSDANLTPQSEVEFDVVLADGGTTGVDTMHVSFTYAGTFWPITYVSYSDPSVEPTLVSVSANFNASTNGLTATFENTSSGASTYMWDFGDGGSSTEENPTHAYAIAGTYSVMLTASDAGGSSASVTKEVTVSEATLTEPAPTPTEDAANVIAMYSDAYTAVSGVDINPNWGQATVTTEQEIVTGDMLVKMEGLNYQGIDFSGNMQNASGKTMIHIDVWTAGAETFNFFLISPGPAETSYSITTTGAQWDSIDIPLTEFSSVVDLTQVMQFKFDDGGSGTSPTIYYDNIYFY